MARRLHTRSSVLIALLALLAVSVLSGGCSDSDSPVEEQDAAAPPTPGPAEIHLVITRDYGGVVLKDVVVAAGEGTDALLVLSENAEVEEVEGFVNSVDGVASTETAAWFFTVDGALPDVGAADFALGGGETVWWDFHDWSGALFVGTAVHAFPVPWAGGPLPVTGGADVSGLDEWAAAGGLALGARRGLDEGRPEDGLIVCTAAEAAATPWLVDLLSDEAGAAPVAVDDGVLSALDTTGTRVTTAAAAVVALPSAVDAEHPLLLVVLADAGAAADAFALFTPAALNGRLAVAVVDGDVVPLPLPPAR